MLALLMGPAEEGKPNKLVIVLEPENLSTLRHGKPIVRALSQFLADETDPSAYELVIAYTPDTEWVAEQLKVGAPFGTAMDESLKRPAVFRRGDVAETMSRLL